ncbi:hypothetical protein SAMN03159463_04116 [Mesorhizobium sp. NFR06]|uniref:hypothetical protein n=1 Tax=Mesorhizobium sp. NFR06 TaxID=1566290 RepID=UPI0008E68010|nr:hypothetical protein [Mesorhizobium sp. NFR06]SFP37577.1 hypothetical protein SAMN03159463_04116 [Mesorhizobium sp. NFR06]
MMKKILAACVLTAALATSGAMAQSTGTSGGGMNGTGSGPATGATPNPATPSTTDTTTTNSTKQSGGMEDRCKDSGANDTDNNTPSGAMTSNMQNCNK